MREKEYVTKQEAWLSRCVRHALGIPAKLPAKEVLLMEEAGLRRRETSRERYRMETWQLEGLKVHYLNKALSLRLITQFQAVIIRGTKDDGMLVFTNVLIANLPRLKEDGKLRAWKLRMERLQLTTKILAIHAGVTERVATHWLNGEDISADKAQALSECLDRLEIEHHQEAGGEDDDEG